MTRRQLVTEGQKAAARARKQRRREAMARSGHPEANARQPRPKRDEHKAWRDEAKRPIGGNPFPTRRGQR